MPLGVSIFVTVIIITGDSHSEVVSYRCNNTGKWLTLYDHIKAAQQRTIIQQTVIGTLAVDGWAVTFGTARMGLGAVPDVTAHPSTASVPASYHSIWHYNCFCTLKG